MATYSEHDGCFEVGLVLYIGRDNGLQVTPFTDGTEPYDLSDVTRVEVVADPIGSAVTGDAFSNDSLDPTGRVTVTPTPDGLWRITAKLGRFDGIVAGDYNVRVIVYDAVHPNGLVILDDQRVALRDVY